MIREKLEEVRNAEWTISKRDGSLILKHKPTIEKTNNITSVHLK
jgi:hypothetical protein